MQNEGESTQDDPMLSTTWYYVHEPRYEHATTRIQRLSETNMEVEVVCFINPTQKVVIKN